MPSGRATVCGALSKHVDHFYTTDIQELLVFSPGHGYKPDGIEGYVYPMSAPQPTGTTPLLRAYHAGNDDYAIFPQSRQAAMAAQGFNSNLKTLGYVYQWPTPKYLGNVMNSRIARPLLLTALVFTASTAVAEIRMTLIPEQPVQNEPVHVHISTDEGDFLDSSTFDYSKSYVFHFGDGTIKVVPVHVTSGTTPPQGKPVEHTYYLGRFPAGTYRAALGPGNPDLENYAEFAFEVTSTTQLRFDADEAENPLDHSGIWWNPDEPGTSIVLKMSPHSRELGGGFYAYDTDGHPVWYALAPGEWLHADLNEYRVKVLRSHGAGFGQPYDPEAFGSAEVGEIALHFIGIDTLQADYKIEGVERSVMLKRFEF